MTLERGAVGRDALVEGIVHAQIRRKVFLDRRVAWQRKMYESRWVGISWPATYGGRDATLMEQIIFDEEYFCAKGESAVPTPASGREAAGRD